MRGEVLDRLLLFHYCFNTAATSPTPLNMFEKYVNIKRASEITGYSKRQIERFIRDNHIPTRYIGLNTQKRIWVYDLHSLMLFHKPFLELKDNERDDVSLIANE